MSDVSTTLDSLCPWTEQQMQTLSLYSPTILGILQARYQAMIEEEERRREEEIKAQAYIPTEEEQMEALQELQTCHLHRVPENENPPLIELRPQPFYVQFLNKRKKRS